MMRMLHLFLGTELQGIYAIREQRYRDRIANYSVAELNSASLDDMVAALVDMCKIEIPVLHDDRVERSEMQGEVPLYYVRPDPMNIDRQGTTQGIIHTIHVPYAGPQEAFYYKPPTYPLQMPAARTTDDEVLFTYAGGNLTADMINQHSTADRRDRNSREPRLLPRRSV